MPERNNGKQNSGIRKTSEVLMTEPRRRRILVVDDEKLISDTLAEIFRSAGYEVEAFCNGAVARDRTQGPDLALIDPMLPGLSGIDLAIDLVTRFPGCKVLLASARSAMDCSDLEAARRRGYDFPLLAKPIAPEELLERVAAELKCRHKSASSAR